MGHDRMIACGDNGCWCYAHQEMLSALEQRISGMTDSRKIIEASLKIAVEYYQADRAFILDIDDELDVGCNTYEYCSNGVDSKRRQLRTVPLELLPKWHEAIHRRRPIIVKMWNGCEVIVRTSLLIFAGSGSVLCAQSLISERKALALSALTIRS